MSGYVVYPDQVRRQADVLADLAARTGQVEHALPVTPLPANAFGRTRHSPVIAKFCADFQHKVVARMTADHGTASRLSASLHKVAVIYPQADIAIARDYTQVAA